MIILPLPPLSPSHSLFHSRSCRLSEVLLTIALILQRSASSSSSLISTTSNSISTASSSAAPVSHRSAFAAPSRTPVRPAAPTVFTVAVACYCCHLSAFAFGCFFLCELLLATASTASRSASRNKIGHCLGMIMLPLPPRSLSLSHVFAVTAESYE
jgi:hypothetical protein